MPPLGLALFESPLSFFLTPTNRSTDLGDILVKSFMASVRLLPFHCTNFARDGRMSRCPTVGIPPTAQSGRAMRLVEELNQALESGGGRSDQRSSMSLQRFFCIEDMRGSSTSENRNELTACCSCPVNSQAISAHVMQLMCSTTRG